MDIIVNYDVSSRRSLRVRYMNRVALHAHVRAGVVVECLHVATERVDGVYEDAKSVKVRVRGQVKSSQE